MNFDPCFISYIRANSTWTLDINFQSKTIKFQTETEEYLHDLWVGKYLLGPQKSINQERNNGKLAYIKINNVCSTKINTESEEANRRGIEELAATRLTGVLK